MASLVYARCFGYWFSFMNTLLLLIYYHYYDVHHCFIRYTIMHHVELMKSEYLRQLVALIYEGDILTSNAFCFHTPFEGTELQSKTLSTMVSVPNISLHSPLQSLVHDLLTNQLYIQLGFIILIQRHTRNKAITQYCTGF
jgi:adenylate cyclase